MKRKGLYIIAALVALLPMLTSCRQELCYDHYPVMDIKFLWEQEWERDYGHHHLANWDANRYGKEYDELRPGMPEWVNMVNYYDDGRHSESFLTPDGKRYIVEQGASGSMLLYNGDTEYIILSDVASLDDARASATSRSRAGSSLSAMYEAYQDSRTTNPPDILYAAFVENVPGLDNHDIHEMSVSMKPLVYTYVLNFVFEYGIHRVALARGAIGGMAEAVYLRTGVTSEETSIILFDCDIQTAGCVSHVRSFGIPGFPDVYYSKKTAKSTENKYTLNLELKLKNGKTVVFDYDVTDQMKAQPRGGVINISGIRIEDDPEEDDSTFDVEVTDWDDDGDVIDIPSFT